MCAHIMGYGIYTDTHQNAVMFGLGVLMYYVYGEIENNLAVDDRFSHCQIVTQISIRLFIATL